MALLVSFGLFNAILDLGVAHTVVSFDMYAVVVWLRDGIDLKFGVFIGESHLTVENAGELGSRTINRSLSISALNVDFVHIVILT